MAVPLLLCGTGILFAMCAACFYCMGAADWADAKKFLIDSLESLASENAKLRELVRSAVRCITDVPDCDSCALGEQVSGVWVCHLIGAAKELGVEVDE